MKNLYLLFINPILLFCLLLISFSNSAIAKEINLLEKPDTGAKVVGKADPSVGIIPVFSQKNGEWVKVADPRTGDVGWVLSKDISSDNNTSFSFQQKIIKDDNGKRQVQTFEFGNMSLDQKKTLESLQKRQEAAQLSAQKAIETMIRDMNKYYQYQLETIKAGNSIFPMFAPAQIIPLPEKSPGKSGTVKAKSNPEQAVKTVPEKK